MHANGSIEIILLK